MQGQEDAGTFKAPQSHFCEKHKKQGLKLSHGLQQDNC